MSLLLALTGGGGPTNYNAAIVEALGLSDSQSSTADMAGAVTEALALVDSQAEVMAAAGAVTEAIALTDSQSSTAAFTAAMVEAIALIDSQDSDGAPSQPTGGRWGPVIDLRHLEEEEMLVITALLGG